MDGDTVNRCAEEAILNDLCPHNSSTHEAPTEMGKKSFTSVSKILLYTKMSTRSMIPRRFLNSNGEELDSDDPKDVSIWRVVAS